MREIKIFFFGDSISFGQGVSPHKVWVSRISAALEDLYPHVSITVQNPSVNGNTTRMALERIAYDVQSHRPDVLVTQFGMNDCNIWETDKGHQRTSPDAFVANMSEIITRGRAFGAREVIIGTNHPSTRTQANLPFSEVTYEQSNQYYNELTRTISARMSATLVDMQRHIEKSVEQGEASFEDFVLADRLHLSVAGHDIYFKHYFAAVQTVLGRLGISAATSV